MVERVVRIVNLVERSLFLQIEVLMLYLRTRLRRIRREIEGMLLTPAYPDNFRLKPCSQSPSHLGDALLPLRSAGVSDAPLVPPSCSFGRSGDMRFLADWLVL